MDRVFILDRSGSMETCWTDTIGGFNSFLADQKATGGTLTLIQFDHEYLESYKRKAIDDVEPLTTETYKPRGSTALLDAIGQTIKNWGGEAAPSIVILTDGQENSSRKYTNNHIKDLIRLSKVEVVYAGADLEDARELGISTRLYYDGTGTPDVMRSLETLSQ